MNLSVINGLNCVCINTYNNTMQKNRTIDNMNCLSLGFFFNSVRGGYTTITGYNTSLYRQYACYFPEQDIKYSYFIYDFFIHPNLDKLFIFN